jgi:hypothetical protein
MKARHMFKSALATLVVLAMLFQLAGCGTLMYPERKGQKAGNIDPGVAALNGIGLLLFLIPGIIAFAVDFSNGTIYLPASSQVDGWSEIHIARDEISREMIEKVIARQTGKNITLGGAEGWVTEIDSLSAAEYILAQQP